MLERIDCLDSYRYAMYDPVMMGGEDYGDVEGIVPDNVVDSIYEPGYTDDVDRSSFDAGDVDLKGMAGAVVVYERFPDVEYPRVVAIYDRTLTRRMESRRGCLVTRHGRFVPDGLMIPQVKFTNNTVRNGAHVRHDIDFVRDVRDGRRSGVSLPGKEVPHGDSGARWMAWDQGFSPEGPFWWRESCNGWYSAFLNGVTHEYDRHAGGMTKAMEGYLASSRIQRHMSFDLVAVIGAVAMKAWLVAEHHAGWRRDRMPSWLYVSVDEVYGALVPGSRFAGLPRSAREDFAFRLRAAMRYLDEHGVMYDMPAAGGSREVRIEPSYLESSAVWRVSRDAGGNRHEVPCGFKVHVKGQWLFDFMFGKCWGAVPGQLRNSQHPRAIRLRKEDYDAGLVLGMGRRSVSTQMMMVFLLSQVKYSCWRQRNGMDTPTNLHGISREDYRSAFLGGFFDLPDPRVLMDRTRAALEYWSVPEADRRSRETGAAAGSRAQVLSCRAVYPKGHDPLKAGGRRRLDYRMEWTPVRRTEKTPLRLKDGHGARVTRAEMKAVEIPDAVRAEAVRMRTVNESNRLHAVTLGRVRLDTDQVLCGRLEKGSRRVIEGLYLRSYSPGRRGVQTLSREDRRRLRIDGSHVAEADYSSLHPRMLYAMAGSAAPSGDIYWSGGRWRRDSGLDAAGLREAVKLALLTMVNARSPVEAREAFRKEWNRRSAAPPGSAVPWSRDLFRSVERRHSAIAKYFYTGVSRRLMWLDGMLIRSVCMRMASMGRCALPVHDSVVVRSGDAGLARTVMLEEFDRMWPGARIEVKIK